MNIWTYIAEIMLISNSRELIASALKTIGIIFPSLLACPLNVS